MIDGYTREFRYDIEGAIGDLQESMRTFREYIKAKEKDRHAEIKAIREMTESDLFSLYEILTQAMMATKYDPKEFVSEAIKEIERLLT